MDVPQVSIDRIGLVRPVENKEMHGHFYGVLKGMKDDPTCKVWQNKYQTTAILPLSPNKTVKQPDCQTLRLHIGISHHKPYFKVDFNPANLGAEEWERLYMEFTCLLEYGYSSLLAEAHVTYLEIAVDCTGLNMKSLLPFDTSVRNSAWYPDFHHPSPTCYLGRRGSKRVIRVYDRVARLQAANKQVPPGPVTRVEAVLRRLNCGTADLALIANPFTSFGVSEAEKASTLWNDPPWCQFLKHTKAVGVPEALQLAGSKRKVFLQRLKQTTYSWWDSAAIWNLYPKAAAVVSPSQSN